MAFGQQEPGAFAAGRKAAGRGRGIAAVADGGSRRSDRRLHKGIVVCAARRGRRRSGKQSARASRPHEAAKRERLEREAERPKPERPSAEARGCAATRLARRTRYAAIVATGLGCDSRGQVQSSGSKDSRRAPAPGGAGRQGSANQAQEPPRRRRVEARDQALRNQSLSLSFLSQQTAAAGDTEAAILLALEALPKNMDAPDRPYLFEAESRSLQGPFRAPTNHDLPP